MALIFYFVVATDPAPIVTAPRLGQTAARLAVTACLALLYLWALAGTQRGWLVMRTHRNRAHRCLRGDR